jgi:hypothetical protein
MFLCGGFTRLGLNADAAGDTAAAGRYGIAAASMIFIFTFTFGATWLTVPWLYPAEIFPLAVRAKGNAWGVVGWSIGNGWLVSSISLSLPECLADGVSDTSTTGLLRQYRRKDLLPLRNRKRHQYSLRMGPLSREQSTNARRDELALCSRYTMELGQR